MDAARFPRLEQAASAFSTSTVKPATPNPPQPPAPKPPEVVTAWPRCAQWAGAFLLGGLVALLGVHALSYLKLGAQPSEIEPAPVITYRVDLNEARRAELLQLPGIGPSMADRIEAYRRKAGGFNQVNDLLKVPGIGPATLERVRPFVTVQGSRAAAPEALENAKPLKTAAAKPASSTDLIDVNSATLAELQKLPGIGPKISQRIVDEREKRPFTSVADLRRVAGIGPKTLEKIKPFVVVK
jgi:competence protein ComEA